MAAGTSRLTLEIWATAWRHARSANRLISRQVRLGHQLSATAPEASGRSCFVGIEQRSTQIDVDTSPGPSCAAGAKSTGPGDGGETVRRAAARSAAVAIAGAGCSTNQTCSSRALHRRQAGGRAAPLARPARIKSRRLSIEEGSAWRETKGPSRNSSALRFGCTPILVANRLNLLADTPAPSVTGRSLATPQPDAYKQGTSPGFLRRRIHAERHSKPLFQRRAEFVMSAP